MLAINTLGVLYLVESGEQVQSIADLRGKTIYSAGKGATPEYALNYILTKNGINPQTDVTIEYKAEHAECVAALTANPDAVAMLPQPFVTTAQTKNESIRIAVDLNEAWEAAAKEDGTESALITGVVVARKEFIEQYPDAVEQFLADYEKSVTFVNEKTDEAAALIGAADIVPEAVAKKALPYCNITLIKGDEMQEKLGGYLEVLYSQNTAAVGGACPDEAFYY